MFEIEIQATRVIVPYDLIEVSVDNTSGFPKVGPPTRSQHAFMETMAFQTLASQIRKRPAPILPRSYYSSMVTGQSTATTELPLVAGAPSIHMARPHDLAGPQISTKRDPGTRGRNSYSLSPNLL